VLALTNQNREAEELLFVLLAGERLAARISALQSRLLHRSQPKISRFLKRQSRQETFHATLFKRAILWVNAKSPYSDCQHPALSLIDAKLEYAIGRGDICASILGLQVIIESLGEYTLLDLNSFLAKKHWGLKKIRHVVLNQEKAHHDFGVNYFASNTLGERERQRLNYISEELLNDVEGLLVELSPVFEAFGISSARYFNDISEQACYALEDTESQTSSANKK